MNAKKFLAYKNLTEQKFSNKVFSYALFLESHRYHNAGKAAWLMEPLDDRVSAYIRKAVKSGCKRLKELQSRVKEIVRNHIFFDENPPSRLSDVDFTQIDAK